jgi:hypothetical protein
VEEAIHPHLTSCFDKIILFVSSSRNMHKLGHISEERAYLCIRDLHKFGGSIVRSLQRNSVGGTHMNKLPIETCSMMSLEIGYIGGFR